MYESSRRKTGSSEENMMKKVSMLICSMILACLCVILFALPLSSARALSSETLFNGCRGEKVRELQQALIDLGYLSGKADGIFGNKTEVAVRKFQKKNKLSADGLAGKKTLQLVLSKVQSKQNNAAVSAEAAPSPSSSASSSDSQETSSLFGTYATIRSGDKGTRVKTLQQTLITLGFLSGKADGIYGNKTLNAVKAFQRSRKLTADGAAGKKTLKAVQSALASAGSTEKQAASATPSPVPAATATPVPVKDSGNLNTKISAPSSVSLLHWFNDVKPSTSGGQRLLVYDPSSGLSWTLRILSRGRHCDAEPLTAQDTRTMVAAFGGVNTWNQKAVYVKLPDGRWTLASTHDMPHQSGSVKDNNFDGHLCVHFLRDMDEARANDPKYGVANQETIRAKWKQMTGEIVP